MTTKNLSTSQIGAAIALAEAIRTLEFRTLQTSPGDEWVDNVDQAKGDVERAKAEYLEAMRGVPL